MVCGWGLQECVWERNASTLLSVLFCSESTFKTWFKLWPLSNAQYFDLDPIQIFFFHSSLTVFYKALFWWRPWLDLILFWKPRCDAVIKICIHRKDAGNAWSTSHILEYTTRKQGTASICESSTERRPLQSSRVTKVPPLPWIIRNAARKADGGPNMTPNRWVGNSCNCW